MQTDKIINGECLKELKKMPNETINCVVTSPPYWGLRDYSTEPAVFGGEDNCIHQWQTNILKPKESNICLKCGSWKGQLGLEPTPEQYVNNLVNIFSEVKRVLKNDGTIWLNLGDTYHSKGNTSKNKGGPDQKNPEGRKREFKEPQSNPHEFLKPKDLVGIPWRVAFALQKELGLYLRQAIIWHKKNAMPSSVTDRPTTDYEFIFLLSKSERYFYDSDAIRQPHIWANKDKRSKKRVETKSGKSSQKNSPYSINGVGYHPKGKNCRAVWSFNTKPYPESHFAVFPEELPERCIKAGTKEGDIVMDIFAGSGTTLWVAKRLKRRYIGIELSKEYIPLIKERLKQEILTI